MEGVDVDEARSVAVTEQALIFGGDERFEYGAADSTYQRWADATAQLVNADKVDCSGSTCTLTSQAWTKDFETGERLCSNVRFRGQPTLSFTLAEGGGGFCTGFLVAPDVVVSAGHCVFGGYDCPDTKFVFGYSANASGGGVPSSVPQSNVYQCESMELPFVEDWVVYKLDRPVEGRVPLFIRHGGQVANNTSLAIIGHPNGLPTKISPSGNVTLNSDSVLFDHNVDSFSGNSGSPVLDRATGIVEGIHVIPADDHFFDSSDAMGACRAETVCPTTGCSGNYSRATRITRASDLVPLHAALTSLVTAI